MDPAPLVPRPEEFNAEPPVPSKQETTDLADTWRQWMSVPQNRALLIQTGLAMSQPISAGQNALGHIGQAVGQGGEAAQRVTDEDMKQREMLSKQDLRESQGVAAEARARAAEARASVAGTQSSAQADRLAFERERLAQQVMLGGLSRTIQAQSAYQRYLKQEADARMLEPTRPPPMEAHEFYQKYGFGDLLRGGTGGSASSTTPPTAYPDAKRAPDGNWYVQKDGKFFRVQE